MVPKRFARLLPSISPDEKISGIDSDALRAI
jgi:hypothetical protein